VPEDHEKREELLVAMWESLVNHIQDKHCHDNPLFPKCEHSDLVGVEREKQWLQPGKPSIIKLDVSKRHVCHLKQTYSDVILAEISAAWIQNFLTNINLKNPARQMD
jgi:hypothetical protein